MNSIYQNRYIIYKNRYNELKNLTGGSRISINDAVKKIRSSSELAYIFADNNFSPEEKKIVNSLNLDKIGTYSYFGPVDPKNKNKQKKYISQFIEQIGNSKKESYAISTLILNKIVIPFLSALNNDAAWITIRIMAPDEMYDTQRWHCDGMYYKAQLDTKNHEIPVKLAAVFRGDGTFFMENNKSVKKGFFDTQLDFYKKNPEYSMQKSLELQKILHKKFKKYRHYQPGENQVGIFVVANNERCAIHSEPPIHEVRFFMSILPGNKKEIKELANKWKKDFNKPVVTWNT